MLGIDLGTTQTKTAIVEATGKPSIVLNARGEERTPSVVHVGSSGQMLVGTDAIEQGYLEPERCVRCFKLDLGSTASLISGRTPFTPTDAAVALIAAQKQAAEKLVAREIDCCVLTCPANFRDDSKQALLEASERSGLKVLALTPEPTAAAIAYRFEKARNKGKICIYDFGGGTFDVSIVEVNGSQLTVLATQGVARLGGNDLDECLRRRVLHEVQSKLGKTPTRESHALFFQDLDQRGAAAKHSLNSRAEVPIVASLDGGQVIVKVSQAEFYSDIAPLIGQSFEALDQAVAAAKLKFDQIDHLVMVGGTSRLPYIQEQLAQRTGLAPKADVDPEKAIAYGAALACMAEMANRGRKATIHGQVIPAPDLFVQDVTAHDVGCCVIDSSRSDRHLINAVIIPANTPIPCKRVDRFFLEHEDQTQARIEILQGKADAARDDCLLIGELTLDSLPREAKATQRIQVAYIIDANGMVTATATDMVGGASTTTSVDYKRGIQPKAKPVAA
jgi:molecular chaperone DnaK